MNEAKFKIGDRVKMVKHSAAEGVIVDAFVSQRSGWRYELESEFGMTFFANEDELVPVLEAKSFSMEIRIDIASNVVIATLYEDDLVTKRPVAKGHGHMIHEGELGVAQAASYACKKLYESLGGTFTKGGICR